MRRLLPVAAISTGIIGAVAMGIAGAQPADTGDAKPAHHARVTLFSDTSTFVAGKPFTIALHFDIEEGWHIYFKDPGDSGMPPEVKWTLPPGMTAGELQFPKPEILKTPAGTNFVYHGQVALLATITPGPAAQIGRSVEITADVAWLECDADACLPGKQSATLRVTAEERITPNRQEQFEAWRVKVKEAESFDPAAAKR